MKHSKNIFYSAIVFMAVLGVCIFASCATQKDSTQLQSGPQGTADAPDVKEKAVEKPPEPPVATPALAATPEDLFRNYSEALRKKDAAAAVACLSSKFLRKQVDQYASRMERNEKMLTELGLTKDDLNLTDDKLYEKILAGAMKKQAGSFSKLEDMKVSVVKVDGEKCAVVINEKGGLLEIELALVKENGFWKIDGVVQNVPSANESGAVASMSAIRSAKAMYKARYKEYGTLANLGAAGYLEDADLTGGRKGEYAYTEDAPTKTTWCVYATPDDPLSLSAFKMDQTGVLQIKRPGEINFTTYDSSEEEHPRTKGIRKLSGPKSAEKKPAEGVGSATGSLSAIRSAQGMYKAQYKTYGTLADLGDAKFIEEAALAAGKKGKYTYTEDAPTKTTWCVQAIPDDPAASNAYMIDQTGVLQVKRPGADTFIQEE
jgi:hypothetical protein